MKNNINNLSHIFILLWLFVFCFFLSPQLWAEGGLAAEKSGVIEAEHNGQKIEFPLLKSNYNVNIQGDLATVELEQWFSNPSHIPLNASYLFPLNKDAAVYAMKMSVGDEVIQAKIKRIEEAKQEFEKAKSEGKAASMLEQHRPNMFTQNIANLMPNLPVKVTLKYTQTVERKDRQYELVLPLLVGPRFQPETAQPPVEVDVSSKTTFNQWELQGLPKASPTMGIDAPKSLEEDRVSITITLQAGLPIQAVSSQTHTLTQQKISDNKTTISLQKGRVIDNRDFVLNYRLSGKSVQAGLLTHKDERGKFFSLMIEPPHISNAANTTAREMVFVLDTSGSMHGQPLDASKAFMQHALKGLRANDYFRIIDFGNSPREFSQSPLQASADNRQIGLKHVQQLEANGGTYIAPAIEKAFDTPAKTNVLRIVVFLTDGYIGNEQDVLSTINNIRGNARIYSLGVGSSVNRYLLDEMGKAGRGFAHYIDPSKNVEDTAIQFANHLSTPVLTDIKIDWGDLKPTELTPRYLPDLFMGDSLRILGKYQQDGDHIINVSGLINGQKANLPLKLSTLSNAPNREAIPLIWARSQIKDWMREFNLPDHLKQAHDVASDSIKQKIVNLGLKYSLMTRWTSFIAISDKVVNESGKAEASQVPLPMPAGVTKNAYSGQNFAGSSAPEPAVIHSLLLVFLTFGAFVWYRRRSQGNAIL